MSRRSLAAVQDAEVVAKSVPALPVSANFRIPDRIILDTLMLIEIGVVVLAATAAKVAYIALLLESEQTLQPYVLAGIAGGVLTHYVLRTWGLHGKAAVIDWRRRLGPLLAAVGLAFLALIAVAFLLKVSADYSRGWLLTWLGLVLLMMPLSRWMSARSLQWLASSGYTERRIAIVAAPETGDQIAERLRAIPGTTVVGVFQETAQALDGASSLRSVAELIAIGQRNQIDEVVLDLSSASQARTTHLLEALSVLPVDVWLCPSGIGVPVLDTRRVGGLNLLQVKPRPIRDWGVLSKAAVDYAGAVVALVLFAPVMALAALAIKLDSPGPVFFRQRRHGYNHRVIDVYKFRTMHVAENGDTVVQAKRDDPRVTRVGRFLRRTSLDELPQLFNVLKGEMSLVGPRPHALAHNKLYGDRLARYANRHCVKPGITGWAQINGFRGPTEDAEKMRKRVELDLHYIEHWSPWMDIKILALTPLLGFVNRNAL